MVVRSASELEQQLNAMIKHATALVELKIKMVVEKSILAFYGEWKPEYYTRTYQLFKSLLHTKISKTSNGYVADVYLDFSRMNHFRGQWVEQTIGRVAADSPVPHGGYMEGTTIWRDPMEELDSEKREILKKMLTEAGINVIN